MSLPGSLHRFVGPLTLACACSSPEPAPNAAPDLAAEFAAIADVEARDGVELSELVARGAVLSQRTEQVVAHLREQQQGFEQAQAMYAESGALARSAGASFDTAASDLRRAEQQYRRAALFVILTAVSQGACATKMSTRQFRARLRAEGVDLDGHDIDHVWPRSRGGADHPLNYQVLESSLNRSLGADVIEKFMSQPLAVLQGLTVSALSALDC